MTDQELSAVVDRAIHSLGEHFEAVQVHVTRTVEGRTHCIHRGVGNWYARQGLAHEFINNEIAQENANSIAEKLRPEE